MADDWTSGSVAAGGSSKFEVWVPKSKNGGMGVPAGTEHGSWCGRSLLQGQGLDGRVWRDVSKSREALQRREGGRVAGRRLVVCRASSLPWHRWRVLGAAHRSGIGSTRTKPKAKGT